MFRSLTAPQALLATFAAIVGVAVPPLGLLAAIAFGIWYACGRKSLMRREEETRIMNKTLFYKGGPWA